MTPPVLFEQVLPWESAEWTDPLDLRIAEGKWTVIRTTPTRSEPLMRLGVGLAAPRQGRISVLGESPFELSNRRLGPFRRLIGTALQPDGLVANLTLRLNMIVPLVFSGVLHIGEAEARTATVLEQFGLTSWADSRPPQLPPDVRQIAALARAAARGPKLLLLEDPLAAVKSRQAAHILEVCRQLAPTALVTSFRRNEPLYEAADVIALWDSRGLLPAEEAA